MPYAKYSTATKKLILAQRWTPPTNEPAHVILHMPDMPDPNHVLNDTNDGIRPMTQAEIDNENDADLNKEIQSKLTGRSILKALVLALNDGSFVPGSNYNVQQIKQIIRDKI